MFSDFKKKLGNRIKEIRKSRGMSREEVAFECDFSGSYMGMIERAEYDFKISMLYNIAKALKIELKDLLNFE